MAKPPATPDPFAGIDNRIRPNVAVEPVDDDLEPDSHSGLADAYRIGWMGQLVDAVQIEKQAWQAATPDFDPIQHIPKGYENYATAYRSALNMDMVNETTRQIDENTKIRARREARGGWSTFGSDLAAGIVDPTNLLGAPVLKGVGILEGGIKGAVGIGTVGAGTELVRGALDPTATAEEIAWGVGGSFVIGGLVGAGAGAIGRTRGPMPLPLRGKAAITSRFGTRKAPKRGASTNHKGVDFAVPPGTPVYAQRAGTVEVARDTGKGGMTVTVNYGGGVKATFMHLSGADVREGDVVKAGQRVARSGNSGNSTGPHLHYSLEVNGQKVDPMKYEGELGTAAAEPRDPAGTVNVFEGIAIPDTIEIDGRGVKVIVGGNEGGAPARYSRGSDAQAIIDSEVRALDVETRALDEDDPYRYFDESNFPDHMDAMAEVQPVPERVTKTVTRYDKKGKAIGTYEIEVPRFSAVPKAADDTVSAAPSYDPARVKAYANRLEARATALEAANAPADKVAALRAAADDALDQLTYSDGQFVTGPDGEVRFMAPEEIRAESYDPDMDELRAMDRDKMRQDFDSGEIPDDLPFGMSHAGDDVIEDGEHIAIDVAGILGSFKDKPWTKPRIAGVSPFADDAFETPSDWLNFVVMHEREHSVNPRMEGETTAAYENRINQRAWEDLQGGKGPFTPTDSLLEKLAIAPSPLGQLGRLIPDKTAAIHESFQALAADFGVMLTRNRQGGASIAGGSVFQKAERWAARMAEVRGSIRSAYLDYLGKTSTGPRLQTEASILAARVPFVGTAARQGQMSLNEFRAAVGQAVVSRTADVPPEARRAAAVFTKVMQDVEGAGRDLGLFQSTKGLRTRAARMERRADQIARSAERFAEGDETRAELEAIAEKMRGDAADLTARADEPVMPSGETDYFPRYWDAAKLKGDPDAAQAMLETGYLREGYGPEAAKGAARAAYQKLVAEPDGDFSPGRPGALNHRSIPVTNDEAWDFIVQDPELLSAVYLRRMGSAIEMTRRYGDPAGLDEVDSLRADLISRGVPAQDREAALQLWEDARDRIAGGFHGKDPMSWDNRAVRALKNLANLAVMGKVIYSQVSDVARVIGTSPGGAMRAVFGAMGGDLARLNKGGYAKQAGEAMELVLARATAHFIESDDALLVTGGSRIERGLANAQTPFFVANLMTPFTVIVKEWMGVVAAHTLIDDVQAVTAAIHAGEQPSAKMVTRLAKFGIDQNDAQLIASMPIEQGDSGLNLPNVMAWEGDRGQRARDLFLAAVNGEIRSAVVTPGPLDRPAIFDGVFHSKKGREEALAEVARLDTAVTDARQNLARFRNLPDNDPGKLAALEELRSATGERNKARRTVGRRGRLEAPIASLPFQMHSFAMAAGGKVAHGLISGADRHRVTTIMSLLAGGAIATWLKTPEGAWDKMDLPELAGHAFDNSSMGAWFSDVVKAADSTTGAYVLGADGLVGAGLTYDDKDRVADNIGNSAGVAPGLIAGLVEAVVTDDLPWDDRVGAVRRSLPFNNLLWWDGTIKELSRAMNDKGPSQFGTQAEGDMLLDDPAAMLPRDPAAMPQPRGDDGFGETTVIQTGTPADQLPKPPPVPAKGKKARKPRRVAPALF